MSDKTMKDLLDLHFDRRSRDFLHTSFPAQITRINSSVSVDVLPLVATMRPDGSVSPYSELFNVRLHTYSASAGEVFISLPTKVGDRVWVFVSERDTALLFSEDRISSTTEKTHDMSDCFCIPAFFTDVNPPQYDPQALVIGNINTTIVVKNDEVSITTNKFNVKADECNIDASTTNISNVTNLVDLNISGDIKHQSVDIGKEHKHILVQVGTGDSGNVKP